MIDYYKKVVFENYINFKGRASRSEFWYFTLMNIIVSVLLMIVDKLLNLSLGLNFFYTLVMLIPSLAVGVRRMHDIGKSGWWFFIFYFIIFIASGVMIASLFISNNTMDGFFLIPMISGVIFFGISAWTLILMCIASEKGINKYGPNPFEEIEELELLGTE